MDRRASVLALDEQITEKEADIIQLKRSRNSLVGIVRIVPPEILGHIFRMNIVFKHPWDGDARFAVIRFESYNFLLVCHHWYQVALRIPELWSSWGRSLADWKRRCLLFESFPIDLVLDGVVCQAGSFDTVLRDALKSRVARDLVRKVHLRGLDVGPLTLIIASLTPDAPDGENIRRVSIESISLTNVDVTNLFARYRFPKLQHLSLFECSNFAFDHLKLSITALVNLSLWGDASSPAHTVSTSQLLFLLSSNPSLQTITLDMPAVNDDIRSDYGLLQVPLPHLKRFFLAMDFRHALTILHRLKFPDVVDQLNLCFRGCALEVAREVIGPYIRNHLRGDPRSKHKLGISASTAFCRTSLEASIVSAGDRPSNLLPEWDRPYATFTVALPRHTSGDERDKLCIDILALLPRERVVRLGTNLSTSLMEELLVTMPNVETFRLTGAAMFEWFLLPHPDGPNARKKLLPSLRSLYLENVEMGDYDWDPLVQYLAHQTSDDQRITLSVFGEGVHMCPYMRQRVRNLVERFLYSPDPEEECPFDYC